MYESAFVVETLVIPNRISAQSRVEVFARFAFLTAITMVRTKMAELVTSLGMGMGTNCTIYFFLATHAVWALIGFVEWTYF